MRKEQRTSYPAVGIKHKSDSPGGLSPEFCILPCKTKLRRNEDFHLLFKFRKGFFYYDASKQFKDGALYVNGKTVTLDLNGHSIVHKNARKYDIISENGNFSLKDSSGKKSAVNGILANGGSVLVDGVTISGSTDAGIRADRLSMTIKNTTFINNRNSAVVTEQDAYTTIDKCFFKSNHESAVYNKDSYITIKNSFFDDNRSDSGDGTSKVGGAIYSHSKLTVDNCKFAYNKAEKGGLY